MGYTVGASSQANRKSKDLCRLTKMNENVKREKVVDSILHKLAGSSVYSTLDAASGFRQIALDEESSKSTTFITPKGRFCFKWLPFVPLFEDGARIGRSLQFAAAVSGASTDVNAKYDKAYSISSVM